LLQAPIFFSKVLKNDILLVMVHRSNRHRF
jgi:hypothetical protein